MVRPRLWAEATPEPPSGGAGISVAQTQQGARQELSPELRVVDLDGHRVLGVVGVLKRELEELGSAQGGIECVLRGDGQAQHAGDALGLGALPVGVNDLQVP